MGLIIARKRKDGTTPTPFLTAEYWGRPRFYDTPTYMPPKRIAVAKKCHRSVIMIAALNPSIPSFPGGQLSIRRAIAVLDSQPTVLPK